MLFTVNHNEANDLISEGEYAVFVKEMEEVKSKSGKDMIKIVLVVRDDVPQKHQKRHIYKYLFKDNQTGLYKKTEFQKISKALALAQGKSYATLDEWFQDCVGKVCIVKILHNEYNGNTSESVTKWIPITSEKLEALAPTVTIDDPNLPF